MKLPPVPRHGILDSAEWFNWMLRANTSIDEQTNDLATVFGVSTVTDFATNVFASDMPMTALTLPVTYRGGAILVMATAHLSANAYTTFSYDSGVIMTLKRKATALNAAARVLLALSAPGGRSDVITDTCSVFAMDQPSATGTCTYALHLETYGVVLDLTVSAADFSLAAVEIR